MRSRPVNGGCLPRPADERYPSLPDLFAAMRGRTERSRTRTVESAAIRVEASRDDAERLTLMLPDPDERNGW